MLKNLNSAIDNSKKESLSAAIIFILFALGIFLRLFLLTKNDLWYDEVLTRLYARFSPFGIRDRMFVIPLKIFWEPPFYYLFMRIWTGFFGIFESALRLPSAIFSIGTLFVFYSLAKRMFNRKVALYALLILTLSPFHLWYAQEARNYALLLFLGSLSTYFLYLYFKDVEKRYIFLYILVTTANLYTSEFAILLFLSQLIFVLFFFRSGFTKAIFLSPAIFFLPWLPLLLKRFHFLENGFWVIKPNSESLFITLHNFILGYSGTKIGYVVSDILLFLVIFIFIINIYKRTIDKRTETILCILLFCLPLIISYLASRLLFSFYLDRGFILLTPYFYILIAIAIDRVSFKTIKFVMIFSFMIILIQGDFRYYSNQMFKPGEKKYHMGVHIKKPIKPLAHFLKDNFKKGDLVIFGNVLPFPPTIYYLYQYYNLPREDILPYCFLESDFIDNTWMRSLRYIDINHQLSIAKTDLLNMANNSGARIFFIGSSWERDGLLDHNSENIRKYLSENLRLTQGLDFDGIKLFIFKTKSGKK
jgi:hypothetical protein